MGEFRTRIIPLSLPTCSQLPTMGKARGPGGSFSLGALSFTTTIPTTTATNKACNKVVKFNQELLLLDKTLATTPSSSLATTTELVSTRPTNPTTPRTSATATDLHGPILTHPKQKKTPQWGPLVLLLFLLLLLHDTKCDQIPQKIFFCR